MYYKNIVNQYFNENIGIIYFDVMIKICEDK